MKNGVEVHYLIPNVKSPKKPTTKGGEQQISLDRGLRWWDNLGPITYLHLISRNICQGRSTPL